MPSNNEEFCWVGKSGKVGERKRDEEYGAWCRIIISPKPPVGALIIEKQQQRTVRWSGSARWCGLGVAIELNRWTDSPNDALRLWVTYEPQGTCSSNCFWNRNNWSRNGTLEIVGVLRLRAVAYLEWLCPGPKFRKINLLVNQNTWDVSHALRRLKVHSLV